MLRMNIVKTGLAVATSALLCHSVWAADDLVSFATGGYATGIRTAAVMHKMDTDHDGMVSREEWTAFQEKVFSMLDKRKTGKIGAKEFLDANNKEVVSFATGGYAHGLMTDEMLKKIDADGDGTISRKEFIDYQLKVFDMLDTSKTHKGMLSQAELFATGGKDPR